MSLYKKPHSKNWYYDVTVQGHRETKSTKKADRREAERVERDVRSRLEAEAARGELANKKDRIPLTNAAARYWKEHGSQLSAADNEWAHLELIVKTIGGDTPLDEISNQHVHAVVEARKQMGVKAATINRTIACLQNLMTRAASRWEQPVRAIAWRDFKESEPKERLRWITKAQADALLADLEKTNPHIADVVRFILLTGLRREEAFQLTWEAVNLETHLARVRVKGGRIREVPLRPEAMDVIKKQTTTEGRIFTTRNYRKAFKAALARVGIEDFRWHDLRHTFATWMGKSGVELEVVSKALGHSSVAVTMKYRHVMHDEVRAALAKMPVPLVSVPQITTVDTTPALMIADETE